MLILGSVLYFGGFIAVMLSIPMGWSMPMAIGGMVAMLLGVALWADEVNGYR